MKYRIPGRILERAIMAWVTVAVGFAPEIGAQERFRRTPPLAEPRQELKLAPIERLELANGLTIATAFRPQSPIITLQLIIKAGEADSPPERPGVADITARMIGRGTRVLSDGQIENMIEAIGADYSANALMDYTVFRFHVFEEHLDRALLVMRIMLLEAVFTERALAAVKRLAFYEHLDRAKDPEELGWRHLLRVLFEGHPYRVATYNEDVIRDIGSRDVAAFYNRFYAPDNAVFLVSGNVNSESIKRKVSEHFRQWGRRDVRRPQVPAPSPNDRERVCFIENPNAQDATVFVGNVAMDSQHPDFFPFLVLNQALGGTTRGRLFMNLRESKAYAYYAFSEAEFFRSSGVFWARARVTPEHIYPAVQEIFREKRSLSSDKAVASEIEEAKAYLIGNLPLRFETFEGFSEWTARIAALELGPDHWDRSLESIMLVNLEKVQAAGQRYFSPTPVVVVVGRREWILDHLRDFRVVEIYDPSGVLKQTLIKGEER